MARGGARKGAGRKRGVPDSIKLSVKSLASVHGQKAIEELARIAFKAEKDETRVSALKELLDRAYGKSPQAIVGSDDDPPVKTILEIAWAGTNASA